MAERGLRLKLGLFVAATLVALAGLVLFFGRAPDWFSNDLRYGVLFTEAPGVGPGTPIRKSGVRIGEVVAIDLDPESGQVRVRIRVDPKFALRTSEDAIITRGFLSGDTAIDFIPRTTESGQQVARGELWPPGADIPGIPPITPRTLLTPASGILANAQSSLDRVALAFQRLEKFQAIQPKLERALDEATETFIAFRTLIPEGKKTLERIQNFLGADVPEPPNGVVPAGLVIAQPLEPSNLRSVIRDIQDVARAVRPAVDDLRAVIRRLEPEVVGTVKSAKQTFDSVNELLSPANRKEVTELIRNANAVAVSIVRIANALTDILAGAEKTLKNIDTVIDSAGLVVTDVRGVTKPLAAKSEVIVTGVIESADQLNKTLTEVRSLLATFSKGNGTVQKLLTDPAIAQNLDEAAGSLANVMQRADKITRDLEVFADKIARRPEIIGLGGVVRPNSGLKDLPGTQLPAYRPEWPPSSSARPVDAGTGTGPTWLPPAQRTQYPPPVQGLPPR